MRLDTRNITLTALGISAEPGKHKIRFYRSEQFVFSTKLISDPALFDVWQVGVGYAEYANRILWTALYKMADMSLSAAGFQENSSLPNASHKARALAKSWSSQDYFWKKLDKHFFLFLRALVENQAEALNGVFGSVMIFPHDARQRRRT